MMSQFHEPGCARSPDIKHCRLAKKYFLFFGGIIILTTLLFTAYTALRLRLRVDSLMSLSAPVGYVRRSPDLATPRFTIEGAAFPEPARLANRDIIHQSGIRG
ncbi:hypothetical protein EVAR_79707_1 [Eumeta japonica]|uniref:Uncharacterized protein n=1 Tax=Eumeta variegata TaxID=151549 RepID=A0A4C1TBR4_EUMVA|nr:hypothetical protein EVAR_79707_1 [Eumeta japonica]